MDDKEKTDFHERLAALEAKLNGGPGQAAICKLHANAVEELKSLLRLMADRIDALNAKFLYATGALAGLMICAPWLRDALVHWIKKP